MAEPMSLTPITPHKDLDDSDEVQLRSEIEWMTELAHDAGVVDETKEEEKK